MDWRVWWADNWQWVAVCAYLYLNVLVLNRRVGSLARFLLEREKGRDGGA